jgi:hypothetical protein
MALVHVFGDESSQNAHRYMVLGTIWENPVCAANLERDAQDLRREYGFKKEFHWQEIKGHQVRAYCALVDLFKVYADQGLIKFRGMVVDQTDQRHKKYSDNDELHFYKMWFWLLYKRLNDNHTYDVFLDRKSNSVPGRLTDLRNALNNRFANDYWQRHNRFRGNVIRRLEPRSGTEIELQMADVFAGAIAYVRNGFLNGASEKNPKARLIMHMWDVLGQGSFECHSVSQNPKFNIWCFSRTN